MARHGPSTGTPKAHRSIRPRSAARGERGRSSATPTPAEPLAELGHSAARARHGLTIAGRALVATGELEAAGDLYDEAELRLRGRWYGLAYLWLGRAERALAAPEARCHRAGDLGQSRPVVTAEPYCRCDGREQTPSDLDR
jgi:hypothetical protein